MTTSDINTLLPDGDTKHLVGELQLIYDSLRDITDLANNDGLRLDSFSVILQMILQKMANTFGEIESNLLTSDFSKVVSNAETDDEKLKIIDAYQRSVESLPYREA